MLTANPLTKYTGAGYRWCGRDAKGILLGEHQTGRIFRLPDGEAQLEPTKFRYLGNGMAYLGGRRERQTA